MNRVKELLKDGYEIQEIVVELGITRQAVHLIYLEILEEYKDSLVDTSNIVFYTSSNFDKSEVSNENLRIRATAFYDREKKDDKRFSRYGTNILLLEALKPIPNNRLSIKLADFFKVNKEPIALDFMIKDFGFDMKIRKNFTELLSYVYGDRIRIHNGYILTHNHAVSIHQIIKAAGAYWKGTVEELFVELYNIEIFCSLFKKKNITTYEKLIISLSNKEMGENFMRVDGKWEIKKEILVDKQIEDEIVQKSIVLTKEYYCGFSLNILKEKLGEKYNKIEIPTLEQILLNSHSFMQYKNEIMLQKYCKKIMSLSSIVVKVLKESDEVSLKHLLELIKAKGRSTSEASLNNSLIELRKSGELKFSLGKNGIKYVRYQKINIS